MLQDSTLNITKLFCSWNKHAAVKWPARPKSAPINLQIGLHLEERPPNNDSWEIAMAPCDVKQVWPSTRIGKDMKPPVWDLRYTDCCSRSAHAGSQRLQRPAWEIPLSDFESIGTPTEAVK